MILFANNKEYASFEIGPDYVDEETERYTTTFELEDEETWTLKVENLPKYADGAAGFRPDDLTVYLTAEAGGEQIDVTSLTDTEGNNFADTYLLNEDNNRSALVIGLPIYLNGEEIQYFWFEEDFEAVEEQVRRSADSDRHYELTTTTDETGRITYLWCYGLRGTEIILIFLKCSGSFILNLSG